MMDPPSPWIMGQQFPGPWLQPQQSPVAQPNEGPSKKSERDAKATRIAIRKEIKEKMDVRRTRGQKPHPVKVKACGGIDGGWEGKNEFDEALRSFVPWIFDVNYVKWKEQSPNNAEMLKSAIDNEFEYVGTKI